MKPIAIVACCSAVVVGMWSCCCDAAAAEGPSLADLSRVVEAQGRLTSGASDLIGSFASGAPFDFSDPKTDDDPTEGRGKKPKPAMVAMAMAGSAAMSMLVMKAMGAIVLFVVHAFLATKLGLIVGAYLLLSKAAEMQRAPAPAKKVIKWTAPAPYEEHAPQTASSYDSHPVSYDSHQQDHQPQHQQPSDQYGAPQQEYGAPQPQQEYGAPQQHQQQYSADFGGGGGDIMQAHYSNLSPVTYRPKTDLGAVVKSKGRA